ncbi:hypothetical protein LBMAG53_27430 [Planctomycetota bacterium]|nr:hypothetical protein LBMAG53_27430 [Planctomycetota bacterium]
MPRALPGFLLLSALAMAAEQPPALAPAPAPAPQPSAAVSLAEAIAWADAANEGPAIAATQVARALAVQRQARSLLLPSATATAGYGTLSNQDDWWGGRSDETLSGSLALTWYLYNGQALPGLRQTERQTEAARLSAWEVRRALAFTVTDGFLDVHAAEQSVAAAERRRATAAQSLTDAKARLNAGLAARGEVARVEVEDASADLALTTARRSLATARLILADVIVRDVPAALGDAIDLEALVAAKVTFQAIPLRAQGETVDVFDPAPPVSLDSVSNPAVQSRLVRTASSLRPDLRALRENLAATQQAVAQNRNQYLPDLTANASYSDRDSNAPRSPENSPEWRASLNLSWNIFDGGRREAQIDAALASRSELALRVMQAERRVVRDLALAAQDLVSGRAAVRQAEVQVKAARINAEDVNQRAKQGLATALEVADANVAAFEADSELVRRRLALAQSWFALRKVIGLWPLDSVPTR